MSDREIDERIAAAREHLARAELATMPVPDGELLPCPFCGGTPYLHDIGDEEPTNAGARVVICGKCQSCSAVQWSEKEDATPHLIEKWNRRASLAREATPKEADDHECSNSTELRKKLYYLQRGYTATGLEGWGCPGCVYVDGVFQSRCGLHEQIDSLRKRVAELEAFVKWRCEGLIVDTNDLEACKRAIQSYAVKAFK